MGVAYVSVSPYSIIQNYSLSTVNWDDRSNHKWTTIGSNRKYGNPKVKDLFWGGFEPNSMELLTNNFKRERHGGVLDLEKKWDIMGCCDGRIKKTVDIDY